MKQIIFIIYFHLYLSNIYCVENCHARFSNVNKYLSSTTPYRFVANYDTESYQFDGCYPERIIGFIRHGTRTPNYRVISRMKNDLPKLKKEIINAVSSKSKDGVLCPDELNNLSSWVYKVDNDKQEKWLTHEGEDEMLELAERLQKRFPEILPEEYSRSSYYFKSTASQRAEESARYFTMGLFGRHKSSSVSYPQCLKQDPILRFYKLCDKWAKTVKKNPKALVEYFNFILSDEVEKTCEDISKRLGLNYTLPFDDVYLMYTTCCFETAWHKHGTAKWCSVFSQSDLEVIDFIDDLKHYWQDGYGHTLNYKMACPAVKDIFSHLDSSSSSNNNATAVFYLTHSGTILKLLSHFGLYKDTFTLRGSLEREVRNSRKWKTSYLDAFGSNLIFVSYMCGDEKKVLVLHQESIVIIPGCPTNNLCPLATLRDKFRDSLDSCNFDEMCSLS